MGIADDVEKKISTSLPKPLPRFLSLHLLFFFFLLPPGNPRHLLFYRLFLCVFMIVLEIDQIQRRGAMVLMFFTTWSWILLAAFFLLGSLASARRVVRDSRHARMRRREEERDGGGGNGSSRSSISSAVKPSSSSTTTTATTIPLLDAAAVALLHVAVPSSLLVVSLTWLLLVPMLLRSSDKARVALTRSLFFNFASYCQHGLNAAFALGDVFLSRVPLLPYLSGALLSLYSSVFGVWALSMGRVGIWLYPFLNAHKPWAAVAYSGIFLSNWLFFGVACGAFKLRDRLLLLGGGGTKKGGGRGAGKKIA